MLKKINKYHLYLNDDKIYKTNDLLQIYEMYVYKY